MSIALVFPGQGSQTPGMLHRLPDHPAVLRTLEEMSGGTEVRKSEMSYGYRAGVFTFIPLQTFL